MGPASVLMVGFAAAAASAAVFNLWLHVVRGRGTLHLWLGVAALGVTGMTFGTAGVYEARTLAGSQQAQLATLACACVLVLGFLRFTALFTGARMRLFETLALGYVLVVTAAALLDPSWFFSGRLTEGRATWLGQEFVEAELSGAAQALFPGHLAILAGLFVVYWRHRHRITRPAPVLVAVALWCLCGVNDIAVAARVYEAPYLMTLGWSGFVIAFTGLLLRRFVESMVQVESSAGALQRLVEERTEELRRKDLQLA
ncbi:MAG: hypothetical protein R3263_04920, partial [Myxococcota bacterium]|nr:hypothetical protein [Myxococcota bacterium]